MTIKSLELKNFQSHKDTVLEFHPGVNCIIGDSRSGKTSILRALNWNRYNKPAGKALNSWWNRKKGDPIDFFSSKIIFDNGEILRARDDHYNGYQINGKSLEAIGQDIPEEVEKLWNMSEVNIQRQFDAPFLLSESKAEVARFLNKTIELDKIDAVLSKAEKKRQDSNKVIKEKEKELDEYKNKLSELDWVEDIERLFIKAERLESIIENKKNEAKSLKNTISYISELQEVIDGFPDNFEYILKKMGEAEKLDSKVFEICKKADTIEVIIRSVKKYEEIISSLLQDDIIKAIESLMGIAENIEEQIDDKEDDINIVRQLIEKVRNSQKIIKNCDEEIKNLELRMPDNCPYCGFQLSQ